MPSVRSRIMPPAHSGDQTEDHDAEDVHMLFDSDHSAGCGKGDGSNEFEYDDKNVQVAASRSYIQRGMPESGSSGIAGGIRRRDIILPVEADALPGAELHGGEIVVQKLLEGFSIFPEEGNSVVIESFGLLHQSAILSGDDGDKADNLNIREAQTHHAPVGVLFHRIRWQEPY